MSFVQDFQQLLRTQPRYNLKQVGAENCVYPASAPYIVYCHKCFWENIG